jgi:hypothetical protein
MCQKRGPTLKGKSFLLLFLIVLSTLGWAATNVEGQEEPKLNVVPPIASAGLDETFTVDVKVANVINLYTYQFRLSWEPTLLDVTSVTEGPFLNAEGTYMTSFTPRIYNTPDPFGVSGYAFVACTLLGEPASAAASGSGTLATLEFLVKEDGNTSLHLYDTKLINSLLVEMSHGTEDGYFQSLPPPEIHVEPSSVVDVSLQPGNAFSINVTVIQAVEVYAWSLNMSWDPALLNITEAKEGSFLNQSAYNTTFNRQILQEEGFLYANCSLFGESPDVSASGNGTLVTVSFLVEAVGSTVFDLYDTKLLGYSGNELPHEAQDGYFDNSGVRRDVSIVSVEASPAAVEAGDSVSVTVVAKNEGDVTENYDVIVYWGDINIGTLSTSDLSPGSQKTLTFSWKTEGIVEGNHTIEAVASAVIWEANTDDNTYVNGYVTITPPEETSSLPPTLIAAVIIVILIVVAVVGVVFLRKKR